MRRGTAIALSTVALTTLIGAIGLLAGVRPIPPSALFDVVAGRGDEELSLILLDMRAPRLLLGALIGAGLAAAGAIIQAMTRNPLGEPGLLGINAGAGLAIVLGIGGVGMSGPGVTLLLAACGAAAAALTVQGIAGLAGRSDGPLRLTLAGVAVGALCFGLTQAVALADPDLFDLVRNWRIGSLAGDAALILPAVTPAFVAGLLLAAGLAPRLNAMALGDDGAAALGVPLAITRGIALLTVALLAGAATAAAGPIAFVGLAAPHAARIFGGADQRVVLALSCAIGAALVMAADTLGRVAAAPAEIPVGVVTALLGAPVLILLVRLDQRLRA
ncbi:MAG: hypothetical protein K0R27_4783 [Xanthobacteraceae bacterium]|jgi:iron complex transport system permease protein|nr:hypothetical protein [Xanthobacteraceae bacterium]